MEHMLPFAINHAVAPRRSFAELVGSQLEVVSVSTPFPWTMIEARPHGIRHNGSGHPTAPRAVQAMPARQA